MRGVLTSSGWLLGIGLTCGAVACGVGAGPSAPDRGGGTAGRSPPAPAQLGSAERPTPESGHGLDSAGPRPVEPVVASGPELWTSDALLLLGKVDGKFVGVPPCREGIEPLAREWNALDAWGRVVGRVRGGVFSGRHGVQLVSGQRGVGVYSTGAHFPSAEWAMSSAELERERVRVLPVARAAGLRGQAELVFFKLSYFERGAAVAGRGKESTALAARFVLVFAEEGLGIFRRFSKQPWAVVYQEPAEPSDWRLFQPRAIVDADRDGTPEVIYHFREDEDGRGHEVMLGSSDAGASWREIANNSDDCP